MASSIEGLRYRLGCSTFSHLSKKAQCALLSRGLLFRKYADELARLEREQKRSAEEISRVLGLLKNEQIERKKAVEQAKVVDDRLAYLLRY